MRKFPLQSTVLEDRQVSLALFSDLVDTDEKSRMASHLLAQDKPELEPIPPQMPDLTQTRLHEFIGPQSWYLFQLIGHGIDWLKDDPSTWEDDAQYAATKAVVRAMPGVNDFSERACRLAEDFKVKN